MCQTAELWKQSFSLFLPTIITGLGYQSTTAQLFTVPPNMTAFFFVLGTSFLSDKIKARGPIMAVGCVVAGAGYIMLLAAKQNAVRYGGTFLVAVGVFPCSAMIMVCDASTTWVQREGSGNEVDFANRDAGLDVEQSRSSLCPSHRRRVPYRAGELRRVSCYVHLPGNGRVSTPPSLCLGLHISLFWETKTNANFQSRLRAWTLCQSGCSGDVLCDSLRPDGVLPMGEQQAGPWGTRREAPAGR
jgi:hypothetical protein